MQESPEELHERLNMPVSRWRSEFTQCRASSAVLFACEFML